MLNRKKVWGRMPRLIRKKNRGEEGRHRHKLERREGEGSVRIVTYNVHKCRGLDRRVLPGRIVEVLREVDADIIALQEVIRAETERREEDQVRFIAEELHLSYAFGENRKLNGGGYGNAILSRLPLGLTQNYDLGHQGREERGCLRADVTLPSGTILHVYNVHLGTAYHERRHQGRRLVQTDMLRGEDVKGPRILIGDFNEWIPGLTSRLLRDYFVGTDIRFHLGRRRTYPGLMPFLHLDHMYFDESLEIERVMLHRTRKALIASDHLPIVADFIIN